MNPGILRRASASGGAVEKPVALTQQLADADGYSIEEGTLFISPMAARHCTQLQKLDIPAEMIFDENSLREYPNGLQVKVWETHYDGTPVEPPTMFTRTVAV